MPNKQYTFQRGRQNVSQRVIPAIPGWDVFIDDAGSPSNAQIKSEDFESRVAVLEAGTPSAGGTVGIIATATGVDAQLGGTLGYTIPVGKALVITSVVFRNASATLAGGTDYDISDGTNVWNVSAISLSAITSSALVKVLNDVTAVPLFAAGETLQLDANTGSTGAATLDIDILGYLVDA